MSVATEPLAPRSRVADSWTWVCGGLLAACLAWAYWPLLAEMVERWSIDPRYSHGFLVPGFAAYLLWLRRGMQKPAPRHATWGGLALIFLGAALYLVGTWYFLNWVAAAALLPSLAGLCVMVGGWQALRWAWPAIGFLIFMIPLPYRVEVALGAPLQKVATLASTYILQTFGLAAVAEGFVIVLPGDIKIGIVEACNGLGMLMMFAAFAVAVALVIERPLLDRVIILLSAVPIALAANITRITVTGLLEATVGSKVAHVVYHDLAGWLMMPLALLTLWLELWLLSRLLVAPPEKAPVTIGPQRAFDPRSPLFPRGR